MLAELFPRRSKAFYLATTMTLLVLASGWTMILAGLASIPDDVGDLRAEAEAPGVAFELIPTVVLSSLIALFAFNLSRAARRHIWLQSAVFLTAFAGCQFLLYEAFASILI